MNDACSIIRLKELMVSACLSSCGRSFHRIPPLYPNVLFKNSVLDFVTAKSVSLFRRLCILTDIFFAK